MNFKEKGIYLTVKIFCTLMFVFAAYVLINLSINQEQWFTLDYLNFAAAGFLTLCSFILWKG